MEKVVKNLQEPLCRMPKKTQLNRPQQRLPAQATASSSSLRMSRTAPRTKSTDEGEEGETCLAAAEVLLGFLWFFSLGFSIIPTKSFRVSIFQQVFWKELNGFPVGFPVGFPFCFAIFHWSPLEFCIFPFFGVWWKCFRFKSLESTRDPRSLLRPPISGVVLLVSCTKNHERPPKTTPFAWCWFSSLTMLFCGFLWWIVPAMKGPMVGGFQFCFLAVFLQRLWFYMGCSKKC